jgi:cytochrome c oxidase assembly protein subunit 15
VKAFKTLAGASTIATFLLISIGGLVRATKSGLGCGDDWPHCSGEVLPPLQDPNQIIEFSHRTAAAIVGFMIAALAVLAFKHYRDRPRILWTSMGALVLVIFQALLGMLVVKLDLAAEMVVVHLAAALSLLALLIYITAAVRRPAENPGDVTLSKRARFAAIWVFVLLLVGSYVSGADAGYAFSDWPLMDGAVIPDLGIEAKAIHFFHRALAAIVGVIVFVVAFDILKKGAEFPAARRFAHAAAGLFAVEVAIGALNVWTRLNSAAVTAHLAIGAAIWGTLVGAAFVTSPAVVRRERNAVPKGSTVAEASGS